MDRAEKQSLENYLLAMGDDELILGHRNSEWCGYAPILEEDIAFANIALDEIGHASAWYALLSELAGEDPQTHPDRLVYVRDASEFRNVRMVELPNGDWAFSMLRQYFFDAYEMVKLRELERNQHLPLAGAAAKIRKEELYHYRHTSAWVKRLGLGTDESHRRLQNALATLWPFTRQLFIPFVDEVSLVSAGFVPFSGAIETAWYEQVVPQLEEAGLQLGDLINEDLEAAGHEGGRDRHTPHLKVLVAELQSVARLESEAGW
jgi:ring-1,2-phenylacetyl-CoA epoxidase subunit PaaC